LPKADEAYGYLRSFKQSNEIWPALDMSPYWTISSIYLWIISGFHRLINIFFGTDVIISGRIFSIICWLLTLRIVLLEEKSVQWKLPVLIFNPLLLVFATRAHPLVPAILLIYVYWKMLGNKRIAGAGLLLTLAVNFQVYTGGIAAMLFAMWDKNFFKKGLQDFAIIAAFAVAGVVLTWITWGGLYPQQFLSHGFYRENHLNGTPSFGYLASILLLPGGYFFIIGDRPYLQLARVSAYNLIVVVLILICCFFLYFTKEIVGVTSLAINQIFGPSGKVIWIAIYGIAGLGWLRVHRDHFFLLFGLLGAGVLLVLLPYFYERITIFASIAPCLGWCLKSTQNEGTTHQVRSLVFCSLFVVLAVIYEFYGSL